MGKAINELGHGLKDIKTAVPRGVMTVTFDLGLVVDALREIDELEQERARVAAERDRLAFEIQILQIGQGALKMEVERLRAAPAPVEIYTNGAPVKVLGNGAVVTIERDGAMTLQARCVEMLVAVPA
jgi:hypothetical protein